MTSCLHCKDVFVSDSDRCKVCKGGKNVHEMKCLVIHVEKLFA